ncbi:MAG: ABC transporter ATP-binding protein [Thaumarchaeota archaeon]|nr:ABC transporter ATP-binding protein [Nitrososphaerota archaeon]
MSGSAELVSRGLTKAYGRRKLALSDVSFAVPTRGIFTLIGRNGAGKTTLTRILATLLEPTSGSASIDGLDVMADARKLRERIAVVPQEARTVAWMTPIQTVSSYLLWRGHSYGESRKRAAEALARVGIEKYSDRLNRMLSGGIKRKVLVSMVLASEARVIFLDEPSTGLDPISRRELWDLLIAIGKERFVFLTTHYLEEAEQVSNRIGILEDGKLLSMGTLEDLRKEMKYGYSLVLPQANSDLPAFVGERYLRRDGQTQILTTEDEALAITRKLVEERVRFSLNPVTLDDIFNYIVSREGGTSGTEEGRR